MNVMASRRKLWIVVTALTLAVVAVSGASGGASDAGSLALNGALTMTSTPGECPPEAPLHTDFCAARVGRGLVPGLGSVFEKYEFYVSEGVCVSGFRVLETTAILTVPGKGDLHLALAGRDDCLPSALVGSRPFTVTDGTGIYVGASGSGLVDHSAYYTTLGAAGTDTWTGTLNVPGLSFDVTAPTLQGMANRTVRIRRTAKRVHVRFIVTGSDQVDGSVATSCTPKSGHRFRVGRTVVKCWATDSSGNTATGSFRVAVRRRS
jgi:HYR domain-containing protein